METLNGACSTCRSGGVSTRQLNESGMVDGSTGSDKDNSWLALRVSRSEKVVWSSGLGSENGYRCPDPSKLLAKSIAKKFSLKLFSSGLLQVTCGLT